MRNPSSASKAATRVRAAHQRLEEWIARESSRPLPDFTLLAMLKRRRLAAKDALHALMRIQRAAPSCRKSNA